MKKKLVCFSRDKKTQTNKQINKSGGVFSNCIQGKLTEILKYDFILFENKMLYN